MSTYVQNLFDKAANYKNAMLNKEEKEKKCGF